MIILIVLLAFEFIFYFVMLPVAILLTIPELLLRIVCCRISGKREVTLFFLPMYTEWGKELTRHADYILARMGDKDDKS